MDNCINSKITIDKTKVIDNVVCVRYDFAMDLLGKSKHENQLLKRKTKYPNHIHILGNTSYISLTYLETLYLNTNNLKSLQQLKSNKI